MKFLVMSVRDAAAEAFGQPMCQLSRGGAIRSFGDEVNRKDAGNVLNQHPEHFALYELGTFDDSNGRYALHADPQQIALATDMVRT